MRGAGLLLVAGLLVGPAASFILRVRVAPAWTWRESRLWSESKGTDAEADCSTIDTPAEILGELAARSLPMTPDAELTPETVTLGIFRGLQFNDVPHRNAGLQRLFEFTTLNCRVALSGVGRQVENRPMDVFVEKAAIGPLQPIIGASKVQFGPVSIMQGTPTRGAMANLNVKAQAAPEYALRHPSGHLKNQVAPAAPFRIFQVRLQQQRGGPLAGAWMVTDIIDLSVVASAHRPLNQE